MGIVGSIGGMDAAKVVTSVHKEEITRQIDADYEQDFSQYLFEVDRSSVLDRSYRGRILRPFYDLDAILELELERHDSEHETSFLERYRRCRTMAWQFLDPETLLIKAHSNSCRLRWCPMCGKARVNTITHNCSEFFSKQRLFGS